MLTELRYIYVEYATRKPFTELFTDVAIMTFELST